jgi:hypothetical protein
MIEKSLSESDGMPDMLQMFDYTGCCDWQYHFAGEFSRFSAYIEAHCCGNSVSLILLTIHFNFILLNKHKI